MEFMRRYERDNVLIIFSGGVDSSLILLQECKKREGTKDKSGIYTIYFDTDVQGGTKCENEIEHMTKIIRKAQEEFDVKINSIIYKDDISGFDLTEEEPKKISRNINNGNKYVSNRMVPQTMIWQGIIMRILPQMPSGSIEIIFGFVLDDNFPAYSANIVKNQIEEWCRLYTIDPDSEINVSFPLLTYKKPWIYREFIQEFYDYFKMTWTCEDPDEDKVCGCCRPCRDKYHTLLEIEFDSSGSDYTKSVVLSGTDAITDKVLKIRNLQIKKNEIEKEINELRDNDKNRDSVTNIINLEA